MLDPGAERQVLRLDESFHAFGDHARAIHDEEGGHGLDPVGSRGRVGRLFPRDLKPKMVPITKRPRRLFRILRDREEEPLLSLERTRERTEARNHELARGAVLFEENEHAAARVDQIREPPVAGADERKIEVRRAGAG